LAYVIQTASLTIFYVALIASPQERYCTIITGCALIGDFAMTAIRNAATNTNLILRA
jgi:hypothetical protein